ncbi:carboxypeptidase-like regulatory domain-containing protein [Urbifossiella limnaea]|uniref:Carboxypeptidase regulatory-like domain-containing protein n=1 Tax=Urbifossiella limnaea TaxID=2528023 RepID=A0A517XPC6_9BACT|nr:carboxypeptidase-like regulatory domain-containing protein [Urbifossiella limnaea]QDU19354.1 hypothetical protein ETAA1_12610 [Urbifossiella limnaea]
MVQSIRLLRPCSVLIALVGLPAIAHGQKVKGVVVDSTKQPIQGVSVELHPTGKNDSVHSVITNKDGVYEFNGLKYDAAYDIIYSHSNMDTVVISRLAESKAQEINNVMYRKGQPRPGLALLETLQSAERLLLLAASKEKAEEKQRLLARFDDETQRYLFGNTNLFLPGEDNTVAVYVTDRRRSVTALFKPVVK